MAWSGSSAPELVPAGEPSCTEGTDSVLGLDPSPRVSLSLIFRAAAATKARDADGRLKSGFERERWIPEFC